MQFSFLACLFIFLTTSSAQGVTERRNRNVTTGLLDAMYLADNLTTGKFDSIQSAIDNYEEKMFEYASEAQQQTATNEKQLFLSKLI